MIGAEASPEQPPVTRGHCGLQGMSVMNPRALFCYNWIMEHQVCVFLCSLGGIPNLPTLTLPTDIILASPTLYGAGLV